MHMRRWLVSTVTALALALLAFSPAHAQGKVEPEKYFPEGTDVIVQINLNQLLGSPMLQKVIPLVVKKYGEDALNFAANFTPDENAAKMIREVAPKLKDQVTEAAVTQGMNAARGFIQDFVVAVNTEKAGGEPEVVMTLRSPFIQEAMVDQVIQAAGATGQAKIKTEKVGEKTLYEVEAQNSPQPFFFTLPEDGIVVMSPFKASVEKVLKNKGGAKLDAKLKGLWEQRKPGYTVFAVGVPPAEQSEGMNNFVASFTLDKDLTGNVVVDCKDADTAKEQGAKVNESVEGAVNGIAGFLEDRAELKPLVDALKKMKAEVNGKQITMKLSVKGDDVISALKSAK